MWWCRIANAWVHDSARGGGVSITPTWRAHTVNRRPQTPRFSSPLHVRPLHLLEHMRSRSAPTQSGTASDHIRNSGSQWTFLVVAKLVFARVHGRDKCSDRRDSRQVFGEMANTCHVPPFWSFWRLPRGRITEIISKPAVLVAVRSGPCGPGNAPGAAPSRGLCRFMG